MVMDHIGVLVKSIEKGILFWEEAFGYKQYTEVVINKRENVKVVFLENDNSILVKLIEPIDRSSTIYHSAQKRGGVHHICFKCENIEEEIIRLKSLGFHLTTKPQPGEAFENNPIAFLFSPQGVSIELIDADVKAKIIT